MILAHPNPTHSLKVILLVWVCPLTAALWPNDPLQIMCGLMLGRTAISHILFKCLWNVFEPKEEYGVRGL